MPHIDENPLSNINALLGLPQPEKRNQTEIHEYSCQCWDCFLAGNGADPVESLIIPDNQLANTPIERDNNGKHEVVKILGSSTNDRPGQPVLTARPVVMPRYKTYRTPD